MPHRVEVGMKPGMPDPAGQSTRRRLAEDMGVTVEDVRVIDVYTIDAELSPEELDRVREELFCDPVIQEASSDSPLARMPYAYVIEVGFRPGVTDNVGKSAAEGVADVIGRALAPGEAVYKSTQYVVSGAVDEALCERMARDFLANELIQRWVVKSAEDMASLTDRHLLGLPIVTGRTEATVHEIDLNVSDEALMQLSRDGMFALDLDEMKEIQSHYADPATRAAREAAGLPACPTDIELEMLAQTWSEHCKHKIFNAIIDYDDAGTPRTIDSLFRSYVKRTTDEVSKRVDWLVSVFHDNAGLIRFDEDHHFALKVETHNSPSALDPYGGAMTGIVGVNRDILGAGLGCRCILNTDVFCFASPFHEGAIPPRLLHPRRVFRGVHQGVKDGGNQSGIPDVNGAIVFHERFLGKPLVFCGTGGIIPRRVAGKPSHEKTARPGDLVVMVGGRIGKDGIHGATFSSEELHEGSPATAVQIGDPITQKKMADFIIEARDLGLFTAITDNGAGGLSSSVGEMARGSGGAVLNLERAPLKYAGLAPWEILLSEAQERMSLAVPPANIDEFQQLAVKHAVESTVLGVFTDSGRFECRYDGKLIGSLDMGFLHDGVPKMHLRATWPVTKPDIEVLPGGGDLAADLKAVLGSLNVCSKETFVRMYDHEVQAQSVLKQFQGVMHDGPGDAGVIRPVPGSRRGLAISCGICPKYSDLDTYAMMACAIDEAVRNLVAVGGRIGTIAGLDNFCWPDPVESEKTPDGAYKLAQLIRACEALYDVCSAYDIPLISGKDSMKNDYRIGDLRISIPPTVLFTAVAVMEDATRVASMDVKRLGDIVYVLGDTRHEMGGSEYLALRGQLGSSVPQVDAAAFRTRYERLADVIERGLVASCHDCSDGGLGVALAESAFAGGLGMRIDLAPVGLGDDVAALFSESQGRFVVTVHPGHAGTFERAMTGCPLARLGEVAAGEQLIIQRAGRTVAEASLAELKEAWQRPLRW